MYKIVITDYYYAGLDIELREFAALAGDIEILDCTTIKPGGLKEPDELIPYVRDADALIVQFASVTAEVIRAMEKCKVIARYAIGVDTIDVDAATERGIWVSNVPDYCTQEVANTAIAHIMNAERKLSVSRDLLLRGDFRPAAIQPAWRMERQTLCLLGFGRIAREVARKMKPFFAHMIAYDPYFKDTADHPDVRFVDFETALAEADVISLHIPLSEETRNMLSRGQFRQMKDGVILVNTARGGLIDEAALLEALDSGKVGFCGLDVLSTEAYASSALLQNEKVMLTPHIGWYSEEAGQDLRQKVAKNVVAVLTQNRPLYHVNAPRIAGAERKRHDEA